MSGLHAPRGEPVMAPHPTCGHSDTYSQSTVGDSDPGPSMKCETPVHVENPSHDSRMYMENMVVSPRGGNKMQGLTFAAVQACFCLPLSVAAKNLGVSKTLLKNACRKLGIRKWPFRQLQAFGDPSNPKKRKRSTGVETNSGAQQQDIRQQGSQNMMFSTTYQDGRYNPEACGGNIEIDVENDQYWFDDVLDEVFERDRAPNRQAGQNGTKDMMQQEANQEIEDDDCKSVAQSMGQSVAQSYVGSFDDGRSVAQSVAQSFDDGRSVAQSFDDGRSVAQSFDDGRSAARSVAQSYDDGWSMAHQSADDGRSVAQSFDDGRSVAQSFDDGRSVARSMAQSMRGSMAESYVGSFAASAVTDTVQRPNWNDRNSPMYKHERKAPASSSCEFEEPVCVVSSAWQNLYKRSAANNAASKHATTFSTAAGMYRVFS